jgi:putative ABC transport system permease protein
MVSNYIKIALRNIRKHKIYALINISGLAIGTACCILIFLYVNFEMSFDRYHDDAERVFRVAMKIENVSDVLETARISTPLVPALRDNFPEVEYATRVQTQEWRRNLVEHEDTAFYEKLVMVADTEIFNVLTLPFLKGRQETALLRPNTVVISQSMANKYFGQMDPFGQIINIWGRPFEITGLVKDAPENTHAKYGLIISLASFEDEWNMDNWGWTGFYSYIKLKPGVDPGVFEEKIRNIGRLYIPEKLDEWKQNYTYYLQPIAKIHLHSKLFGEIEAPGNSAYLVMISCVGFLILLLSIFNFTNLSTAISAQRSKEVGIRKVVGALKRQLIQQFLTDSFLLVFLSTCLAVLLSALLLPFFNSLTGKQLNLQALNHPALILLLLSLTLFIGLAGGGYPSFLLSFQKPSQALKGKISSRGKSLYLRKILVLGQFSITILLLIGTIIVGQQIKYMKNRPLGFDKEQKLVIPAVLSGNYEQIKSEFLNNPSILDAAACWSVPGRTTNRIEAKIVGQEEEMSQSMDFLYIDDDFIPAYKIKIAAGRTFDRNLTTDIKDAFIINEAASQTFGFLSPGDAVGQRMYEGGSGNVGTIIGVMEDFNYKGLQNAVEPLVFQFNPAYFSQLSLTLSTVNLSETVAWVEKKWNELRLGQVFSYFFLDEDFNRQYAAEEFISSLATALTLIALFISCLGLVGLSSFTAEQKTKEIGIRKVLGATVPGLFVLFTREFTQWVLLANLFAWPTAYLISAHWLKSFAYRMNIDFKVFVLSGVLVLFVSVFAVSFQSVRISLTNPADSLRHE